jgi:dsDNA-specific endonuclease/ATPase MutS2
MLTLSQSCFIIKLKLKMKIKIGDIVAVIDDVIKGEVISISGVKITVESEGFPYVFTEKELVIIKEDQSDLAKYSDLTHEHLIEKEDVEKKKKSPFKSDNSAKNVPAMEVDLHIGQLTASTRGMDNYDMLTIQLEQAQQKLEFAIRNRIPKVVFIHGVGAGVLKTELEYLFKKYPCEWYAASFQKYGLGATEVYIYQNPK